MKRGRPSTGGNTRNTDYYVKKIRISDAKGCGKIFNYFTANSPDTSIAKTPNENSSQRGDLTIDNANVCIAEDEPIENSSPPVQMEISSLSSCAKDEIFPKEISSSKEDNFRKYEIPLVENEEMPPVEDNFPNNEVSPAETENVVQNKISSPEYQFEKETSPAKDSFEKKEILLKSNGETLEDEENFPRKHYSLNIQKYEKLNNWIYYSVSGEGFFCKLCSICFTKGPWIDQAVCLGDHPSRCITRHEDSARHNQAVAASKINKPVSESLEEGSKAVAQKAKETNQKLMAKYIKILYFMIKKQWAVTENFASLVKLIGQDLGDKDIESYLNTCGKNSTYLSNVSVQNLTEAISIFLEEKTITSLQLSENFALLADESTDEAQREQLGLVARYKVPGLAEIKEEYLGIINLSKTNAECITSAIEGFLLAKNIKMTDCLFLALDGDNVMSGEISGVQRRIRHLSPHSLYVNCRNHRLALVFAHLLKKYNCLQAVDALLVSLWKLFHYSPTKQQVFKDMQSDVYAVEILKTLKVSVTRWLSHGAACKRVADWYQPLVETLDGIFYQTKEPEIKGIREQLLDPENLLCILFLADFLKIINKFSLWLQSPNIMFSDVSDKVSVIVREVDEYATNLDAGEHFKKCNVLLVFAKECTELSLKTRRHKKQRLNSVEVVEDFKESFVKLFIHDFKEEMKNAFKIDSEVLGAYDVFSSLDLNLTTKNDADKTCLSVLLSFYGQEQKNEFQSAFKVSPPVIDAAAAIKEVPAFEKEVALAKITFDLEKGMEAKALLRQDKKEQAKKIIENKISPIQAMKIISRDSSNNFPNMMKLLALSTIIPSSTASVERLFSRMNLVCTELKTCLKQSTLDRHLRIILNGPDKLTNKECEEIINIFKQTGNRHIQL